MIGVVVDVARPVEPKPELLTAHVSGFVWPSEPALQQRLEPSPIGVGSTGLPTQIERCLPGGWPWTPGNLPREFERRGYEGLPRAGLGAPPNVER